MKKIMVQLSAFLLLWNYSVYAESLSSVANLIAQNKYEEAIQILEPLAQAENGDAQNQLGEIYHFGGEGIQLNVKRSFDWYTKAFSLGHKEAATRLGRMHMNGEGVPKDSLKAKEWYSKGNTKI